MTKAQKKAKKQAERAARKAGDASLQHPPLGHATSTASNQDQDSTKDSSTGYKRGTGITSTGDKRARDTSKHRSGPANTTHTPGTTSKKHAQQKEFSLFSHLVPSAGRSSKSLAPLLRDISLKNHHLHPSILRLGHLLQTHKITGSNARAIALMQAFRALIQDYKSPPNTALCRHLEAYLKPQINYLVACRALSVSMGNCIRFLKLEIAAVSPDVPEDDAKAYLDDVICHYVRERIVAADSVMVELALKKIRPRDVLLTFGHSSVVKKLLIRAHEEGIPFRVIIVDSRPLHEGKTLLKALCHAGIQCTFIPISALSFSMRTVSKVFLGAHALLSNGALMARTGSALVALMAREVGVPVITLCETYKFSERVQLDSFVVNELAEPGDLVDVGRYRPVEETTLSFSPTLATLPGSTSDPSSLSTPTSATVPDTLSSITGPSSSTSEALPTSFATSFPSSSTTFATSNSGTLLNPLENWKDVPDLRLLNLMYDVTPSEFISMVVTEIGLIPGSSVPVVIREGVNKSGAGGRGVVGFGQRREIGSEV